MTFYEILCLLGVPSFSVVTVIITKLWNHYRENKVKIEDNDKKTHAVQLGVQALLRSQMINDYNRWVEKGYAPIYARDNFDNCWKQYHELGANGVMNDIHKKFMALPTQPPV